MKELYKMFVSTNEITKINTNSSVVTDEFAADSEIRQLQLANLPNFPLGELLRHSEGIEVLEPLELREKMRQMIAETLKRY